MQAHQSSIEIRNLLQDPVGIGEAVVLIDGRDQLALMGRTSGQRNTWVGHHPDDVLGPDSPLLPRDEPHDAFVAVCSCTFLECGGLVARIYERGSAVFWEDFRDGSDARSEQRPIEAEPFVFDKAEYRKAVLGLDVSKSDWEPKTRQAAQLVNESLAGRELKTHRLKVGGCWHVDDSRIGMTMFFGVAGDADRAMLDTVLSLKEHESADELAERAVKFVESGAVVADDKTKRHDISGDSK